MVTAVRQTFWCNKTSRYFLHKSYWIRQNKNTCWYPQPSFPVISVPETFCRETHIMILTLIDVMREHTPSRCKRRTNFHSVTWLTSPFQLISSHFKTSPHKQLIPLQQLNFPKTIPSTFLLPSSIIVEWKSWRKSVTRWHFTPRFVVSKTRFSFCSFPHLSLTIVCQIL